MSNDFWVGITIVFGSQALEMATESFAERSNKPAGPCALS